MQYKNLKRLVICITTAILVALTVNNFNIWLDESFTMEVIGGTYAEAMRMIFSDVVHPPLYYIVLKTWNTVFSFTGIHPIVLAKLFSEFWIILALIQGSRMIEKLYDDKMALTFLIFNISTQIIGYAFEIRMYSMAMYFVLMAWLYMNALLGEDTKSNRFYFILFSILGAWTHYFAIVSLSLGWFILLAHDIHEKRIRTWILSFLIVCLFYSPWLYFMIKAQVPSDSASALTLSNIISFAIYPFYTHNTPLTLCVALSTLILFVLYFIQKKKDTWITASFLLPVYIGVIGIVLSLLTGKFFTGKYLLPGWMVFQTGVALFVSKTDHQKEIRILFTIFSVLTLFTTAVYEQNDRESSQEVMSILSSGSTVYASGDIASFLTIMDSDANVVPYIQEDENAYYILADIQLNQLPENAEKISDITLGGMSSGIYKTGD